MSVSPAPFAPGRAVDYAAVEDYLFSLKARGVTYGIDRMQVLVEELGHPELAVPTVHITGTNGKGSTAAMLETIWREAGWKTGLYTSPHLVRLGERIQVNRERLTEAEIVAFVQELHPVAERIGRFDASRAPSFFEFMTAMAFLQFARQRCDIALVEVGLGGRLDATNVVRPEVAVITSISLDHCEMLGTTIEAIAMEKAGIIKPGRPVVLGRLPAAAEAVIRDIAAARGSPVFSVRESFGEDLANYPTTQLEGDYQRWNAATATLTARVLAPVWRLTEAGVARALQHVHWPGRWQRLTCGERTLILDASHNPEGAAVLDSNLRRLVASTGRAPVVIVGVLGTVRALPLIEVICRHARELYLVVPKQPRSCSQAELAALVPPEFAGPVHASDVTTLFPEGQTCLAGQPGDTVVVTGSIYLTGEVLTRLASPVERGEAHLQDG